MLPRRASIAGISAFDAPPPSVASRLLEARVKTHNATM